MFRRQQLQAQQQQQQRQQQQQQQQLEALPGRSLKTPKTHSLQIPGVGRSVGGKNSVRNFSLFEKPFKTGALGQIQ